MKTILMEMLGVAAMSLDASLALWWISVPLAILFLVSISHLIYRRAKFQPVTIALCAVLLVSAIVFSAMAVLFEATPTSPTAVEDSVVPSRVLDLLIVAAMIAVGVCVYMSEGQRAVATSTALFGGCLMFWVYFVAAMSVSGTWL